jgi:hypothetical protein
VASATREAARWVGYSGLIAGTDLVPPAIGS